MKSLALFALSALATASYALTPAPMGQITIAGYSSQTASVNNSTVKNTAEANSYANQNIASNKGSVNVKLGGVSIQNASIDGSNVENHAKNAGDIAVQSLASNVGKVSISGRSEQTATVVNSTMKNVAEGNGCVGCEEETAVAYQNAASNHGEVTIGANATSKQVFGMSGDSTAINKALGGNAVAVQNMSSNYGKVAITGTSLQNTYITGHSFVGNFANGDNAVAYQNLASNDACEPPPPICVGPACGPFASLVPHR